MDGLLKTGGGRGFPFSPAGSKRIGSKPFANQAEGGWERGRYGIGVS